MYAWTWVNRNPHASPFVFSPWRGPEVPSGPSGVLWRRRARALFLPVIALACLLLVTGCQGAASPGAAATPQKAAPPDLNDACPDQLQDLTGELLLYYAKNGALPDSLDDLHRAGPGPSLALACPTCRTPYIYDPEGIPIPGLPGRLIVYDATPCHNGQRWGILAERPRPGKPVFFRVIHPPESIFPHL